MYVIQKSECFSDQIQLTDQSGKSMVLDIRLDITPQCAKQFRTLQVKLLDLQQSAKKAPNSPEVLEETGRVVSELLSLIFGEDNLKSMTEFYGGNYIALLGDIFPYIQEVVVPKFSELAKNRQRQMKRRFR